LIGVGGTTLIVTPGAVRIIGRARIIAGARIRPAEWRSRSTYDGAGSVDCASRDGAGGVDRASRQVGTGANRIAAIGMRSPPVVSIRMGSNPLWRLRAGVTRLRALDRKRDAMLFGPAERE